jgi:hypothetical protein
MAFSYSPKIVTDGLVLYLDAANTKSYLGSGTTWSDISRGGNNGTLVNGPTYSTTNGGSIVFDGIDDSVNIPNIPNLLLTFNDTITYEVIIKIPSSSTWSNGFAGNIISRGTYAGFNGLGKSTTNNQILSYYRGSTSGTASAGAFITRDQWHHCVSIWNGVSSLIYINGELKSTSTVTLVGDPDQTTISIAGVRALGGNNGLPFEGGIGFSRIYNRALSATEVLQNYNATKTRYGL